MREIRVFAPAKLNLYLDVIEKRPDGYHNIRTIFEKIDLLDEILIKEKGKYLSIIVDDPNCASGKDNIVYKALKALFSEAKVNIGVEIVIKKNIPLCAGLGGGSSNAAAVLRSVNELFELGVPKEKLFLIAVELGKDVPFFMIDAPFAVGLERGELLEPINADYSMSHVIVKPRVYLSTIEAYKRIDTIGKKHNNKSDIKKIKNAIKKKNISSIKENYYNIFEQALGEFESEVNKAKHLISNTIKGPSFLSGSGPSVYCTVEHREEAKGILRKLPKLDNMDMFLATTYKGGIYGDHRSQDIS